MTGLYNRRIFDTRLAGLVSRSDASPISPDNVEKRSHNELDDHYLAIIDIDHFKCVNDKFGHLFGDEVLLMLSQIMRSSFREKDALFRYGGEEFAVLLNGVDQINARLVLERFRHTMERHQFSQIGQVTVSVGFSEVRAWSNPTQIFGQADQALYYAKEHGRNRVDCYESLLEKKEISIPDSGHAEVDLF